MTDDSAEQIELREKIIEQMLGAMHSGIDPVRAATARHGRGGFCRWRFAATAASNCLQRYLRRVRG
jgi:hypothetical protein